MRIVCAWCSKEMGYTRGSMDDHDVITHAICPVCFVKVLEEAGITELSIEPDSLDQHPARPEHDV